MRRLELNRGLEQQIQEWFRVLVIIGALATLPLTAAYWFEWDHWAFTVGDWTVWTIFVAEYGFFMAITSDRWATTKNMWLSVLIVIFSFPLLHEILKTTRIIRLARPVPLIRQGMVVRQIQLFRLSNMRSKGMHVGWTKTKEKLGEDHWITRWMVYMERLKSWLIDKLWPGRSSSSDESDHIEARRESD